MKYIRVCAVLLSVCFGHMVVAQVPVPPPPALTDVFDAFEEPSQAPDEVACTADAKQCPDGSYVGRTGPACAFAPCPAYEEPVHVCDGDVLECPDGTYVHRMGAQCTFPACPEYAESPEHDAAAVEDVETEVVETELPSAPVVPDIPASVADVEPAPMVPDPVPQPAADSASVPYVPTPTYTYAYADAIFARYTTEVWERPGADSVKLGMQEQGAHGTIVGGPIDSGGHLWWQIDYASGHDGWTLESQITAEQVAQVAHNERTAYTEDADTYTTYEASQKQVGETDIVPWWPMPEESDTDASSGGFFSRIAHFFTAWFRD